MERYEQLARHEWEKLYPNGTDCNPRIQNVMWQMWLKAFQVCMSNYRWEDIDTYTAFAQGQLDVLDREIVTKSHEPYRKLKNHQDWLKEYEQQLQTDQNAKS